MPCFICTTCGVQYELSESPPINCRICEDERQYVNASGQQWTTLAQLNQRYNNIVELVADNVYAIYTTPSFAIGQRAHLIISPAGNILWDCISLIDDSTFNLINALGGIKAIAISHPHFFSTIIEWSRAFGNAPVYINASDKDWLGRATEVLRFWENGMTLWDDIKLLQCGGHFPGSCIMHVPVGKGSLFVGDTIQVSPDLKTVSVMYSYPNLIPLPEEAVVKIEKILEPLEYDTMYGAFGRYLKSNAKQSVAFSLGRYKKIFIKLRQ